NMSAGSMVAESENWTLVPAAPAPAPAAPAPITPSKKITVKDSDMYIFQPTGETRRLGAGEVVDEGWARKSVDGYYIDPVSYVRRYKRFGEMVPADWGYQGKNP